MRGVEILFFIILIKGQAKALLSDAELARTRFLLEEEDFINDLSGLIFGEFLLSDPLADHLHTFGGGLSNLRLLIHLVHLLANE